MKKALLIILCAVLLFTVCACKSDKHDDKKTASDAESCAVSGEDLIPIDVVSDTQSAAESAPAVSQSASDYQSAPSEKAEPASSKSVTSQTENRDIPEPGSASSQPAQSIPVTPYINSSGQVELPLLPA